MMHGSRITHTISRTEFKGIISKYKDRVLCSQEALFRLNEGQRKLFKEKELVHIIKNEEPTMVGIQQNLRYAAFFKRKEGYLRIIFALRKNLEIITFFITRYLPMLKHEP